MRIIQRFSLCLLCVFGVLSLVSAAMAQNTDDPRGGAIAEDASLAVTCSFRFCPAATVSQYVVTRNRVHIGIHGPVDDRCNRFGYEFHLEFETEGDKAMFSTFLTAVNAGQRLNITYSASDTIDDCSNYEKLALITGLEIVD